MINNYKDHKKVYTKIICIDIDDAALIKPSTKDKN